jgi:heme/copper-type cytochrome/quinol oxidase subunit 3
MDMNIPYTVEERPDSGLTNGKLGIWLFLASEVMLFGALFSTYIILRMGAPEWPHGELNVPLGTINTIILIGSSMTMVMAWASLKMHDWSKHRLYLIATVVLAIVFLINKYFEYAAHFAAGELPSKSTFLAIYFTLTGLHALHILGGITVMAYFLGPGAKLYQKNPDQFTNRIEYTGLYWHFVDLVWIFLFPVLYLI